MQGCSMLMELDTGAAVSIMLLRQLFVDQSFFFHSAKTVSVYRNF